MGGSAGLVWADPDVKSIEAFRTTVQWWAYHAEAWPDCQIFISFSVLIGLAHWFLSPALQSQMLHMWCLEMFVICGPMKL